MKILITHASAGAGHRKAAEALRNGFIAAGVEASAVRVIDVLDHSNQFFRWAYPAVYMFLVRSAPLLWGFGFNLANAAWLGWLVDPLRRVTNAINAAPFVKLVKVEQPDAVISMHFMSAQLMAHLKRRSGIVTRMITGVTDFGVHRFWINKGTDAYSVASDLTQQELVQKGVPLERIKVTGIPIEQKFARPLDKNAMRKKLGLQPDIATVLVTSGGFGVGPLKEIVRDIDGLDEPLQMLVVCGKNPELFAYFKACSHRKPMAVFEYVHNMDECMAAADLIISKSGGLTVSESMARSLPMIIIKPIPGQETRNAEVLEYYGAGVRALTVEQAGRAVRELLADSGKKLVEMRRKAGQIARPSSAQEFAQWILASLRPTT